MFPESIQGELLWEYGMFGKLERMSSQSQAALNAYKWHRWRSLKHNGSK